MHDVSKANAIKLWWKRILSLRSIVEPHIKWIIVRGEINAYRDVWCSSNIIQTKSMLKLSSCFNQNGTPNADRIHQHLGAKALDEI